MDCNSQASLSFTISWSLLNVHWVRDAIQPSHPLSSLSPLALNLSQHKSLFQRVGFSHQVAKVLELQLKHQSFQWFFRTDFLYDGLIWSPCCPRDSQESSPMPQLKRINSSALSLLYGPTLTSIYDYWKSQSFDRQTFVGKVMYLLFNMLPRLVIAFLPKASFNFMPTVTIQWFWSPGK